MNKEQLKALRDALAEALRTLVVLGSDEVADEQYQRDAAAILAHPAVVAALAGSGSELDASERLTDEQRARQVASVGLRWGSDGWHVFVGAGMLKADVAQTFVPEVARHITDVHNAALAGSGPEGLLDDLIERWHVWNSTADDDLKVMLGLRLMQDAFDALPNLAATPTASPTDLPHPKDHIGLCAMPSCPKYHAASPTEAERVARNISRHIPASPTATGPAPTPGHPAACRCGECGYRRAASPTATGEDEEPESGENNEEMWKRMLE